LHAAHAVDTAFLGNFEGPITLLRLVATPDFRDHWDFRPDFRDFKDLKYFNSSRLDFKKFRSDVRDFSYLQASWISGQI